MDGNKTILQTLTKPIIVGGIGILIAKLVFGEEGNLILFNQVVPGWIGIGGSLVATTLLSESIGNYVLPYLPANMQFAQTEKLIFEPIINAACLYALFSLAVTPGSSTLNYMFLLKVGVLSAVRGQYAYDVIGPMIKL